MATKTLVLRPSFTVAYTGSVEAIPEDTAFEDWYKLVNEEDADSDSTRLNIDADDSSSVTFGFNFDKPVEPILSMKVYMYFSYGIQVTSVKLSCQVLNDSGELIGEETIKQDVASVTSPTYALNVFNISNLYNFLNEIDSGNIHISYTATTNSTKTVNGTNLSQLYIEFEYAESEVENKEILQIKENGIWVLLSGDIYKKENSSWILTDLSNFQNGQNFILNYIE